MHLQSTECVGMLLIFKKDPNIIFYGLYRIGQNMCYLTYKCQKEALPSQARK